MVTYALPNHPTSLMRAIHEDIKASHTKRNTCQNVAALFAIDFFTISNKKKDEIGGAQYFYSDRVDNFEEFAKSSYYANVNDMYIDVINTGKHLEPEELKRIEDIIEGTYRLEKAEPGMHTSIGIYNVNKRIRLIYGAEYGLSVLQTEDDKFVSRIRIPRQDERMEEDEET